MKNIFLLPTEESSRIGRFVDTQKLILRSEKDIPRGENVNIYITSDEEIKEGDWYLDTFNTQRIKANEFSDHKHYGNACKKIIFTTDFRLAPDVQKIDDEFLEWFVKNPTCEFVEVIYGLFNPMERQVDPMNLGQNHSQCVWKYKIIIPKEESKPLDNLEERFKRDMSMIVMPLDNKNIPEEEGSMITDWLDKYGDSKIEKQVEQEAKIMAEKETKPHSFCATPEEKCTMSYCDDNGCQNRKRNLVETENYPIGGYAPGSYWCECVSCKKKFMGDKRAFQCESCAVEMVKKSRLETLEEAATNYSHDWHKITGLDSDDVSPFGASIIDFQAGAKWQLENMPIHIYAENTYVHIEDGTIIVEKNDQTIISYSEDDLREAFKQSRQCKIFEKDMPPVYNEFEDWFTQFKKK